VSLDSAHLDRAGYYALARMPDGKIKDRQLDFYGGLRWRFEEHVPWTRRKIDRVGLFKAKKGLELLEDHIKSAALGFDCFNSGRAFNRNLARF